MKTLGVFWKHIIGVIDDESYLTDNRTEEAFSNIDLRSPYVFKRYIRQLVFHFCVLSDILTAGVPLSCVE